MERIRVSSSNVRAVGYDAEEQILEVEFHSGSIYHYFNVPEYKYEGLMRASSKAATSMIILRAPTGIDR
jgi:hypothetical protein